ncbi:Nucleic-acid-binding protein from mobile element jockey [Holothuria leucospilota]|uniref:Nucleic-acid-binding protein from mobile element jockey n=1 Tax=Holothuria leucospilota TaxID=206669 RepID=A0A9Q1HD94_HOLLE|nr:Nucleic-acid-binding protein from mobile element jockey [Holothuria leucospilota]
MEEPEIFRAAPEDEGEFQVVRRKAPKRAKFSSNDSEPPNSPPRQSYPQPIIVTGIAQEALNNPIKLARLIEKEKPNATIRDIKSTKNNAILIFPIDPHSANALLQPWTQNSQLGNPKPRITQQREAPAIAVVVCGINPQISDQEITTELKDQGYNPKLVKRLISKETQKKTWKLKIILEDITEKNQLMKEGLILGYQKHRVENYKEPPTIIQCFKCQSFGHTYHNCSSASKCLRCGEEHNIKIVKKKKSKKKCANCQGDHIAMYKGCPAYQKARLEAKETTPKTYAEATKIQITNKLPKTEKTNITLFCAELIRACLTKVNISIRSSDILSYASHLAMIHFNLNVKGEELFEIIKNPPLDEAVDRAKKQATEATNG